MKHKALKSGIELFIILVSAVVAAYAWFNHQTYAKPTDLAMSTKSFIDLLISTDNGHTWSSKSNLNIPEDFVFGNEVTGDGINFYVKNLEKDDGTPINFIPATANKDYLEFQLLFKSTNNCGVFLEENSFINPLAGTTSEELIGSDVTSKSNSGDFSRDLIAGTTRIAIIKNELVANRYYPTNKPSLLWAPNPNIKVDCSSGYCESSITSVDSQNYQYVDALDDTYYSQKMPSNIKDTIRASYSNNTPNGDPMLFYIDDVDKVYSVTIRIWIEGNDRDAVTALTGGEFVTNLSFIAFNKQLNSNIPDVSINGLSINDTDETMEYSSDYGLNWQDSIPDISSGTTLFIRYKETSTSFASEYQIINF